MSECSETPLLQPNQIPSMKRDLMNGLLEMRKSKEMCDIVIITQNNFQHDAHSVVLAAASPVFKVMVTKEFKEFHSKTINLPDIPENIMDKILDFVYSGTIELTNDNAIEIFTFADRLELTALILQCKEFISTQLDIHNCLGVRRLGDRYCHRDIVVSATTYMLQMFQEFSATDDFLHLNQLELFDLLTNDELNVEKEELLFDILFRWVDHDRSRKDHLKELLKCLRYTMMNVKSIEEAFDKSPLLKSKSLQKLGKLIVNGCTDFNNRIDAQTNNSLEWLLSEHRVPPQIIFLIGGWNRGRTLDICECYNSKSKQWYVTDHLRDPAGARSYFGVEHLNKYVYVVGGSGSPHNDRVLCILGGYDGRHYLNTGRKYDPVKREWSDIANLHIRRCFTSVVTNKGDIYAIAGFDGSRRLTSVERYSPKANQWVLLRPLLAPRSDAAAVVHAGKIYVCGGYGGDSLCSVELFDEEANTWRNITPMNCKRSGAGVVSLPDKNKIIIIGGYNGVSRVRTTEYYDPESDTWTYGPPMVQSRSNFATCVVGKSLYVIGGYTGHATIPDVERFDFVENKWASVSPLNVSRSAMKAVLLGNLPNIKEYFEGGTQSLERAHNNPDFWAKRFLEETNERRRSVS